MEVICAWCQRLLQSGTLPASHGMCADCARNFPGVSISQSLREIAPRTLASDLAEDR